MESEASNKLSLTSTLQNHLRLDKQYFQLFQQVTRYSKDLYNATLYIQRQAFFSTGKILSMGKLFKQIKRMKEYTRLPSDLAQQVLFQVKHTFSSFFQLLKKKKAGKYQERVRLPHYLDRDDHNLLTFISRQIKLDNGKMRLSLGHRGRQSTGIRYIHLDRPPLGIEPTQVRILPRYKAHYFEIEYVYELPVILRDQPPVPGSYLSVDLGLDNFATCVATNGTAFIIEGSGIKSFNRWWNKRVAHYQSRINRNGITGPTKRMARMQKYRRDVINNFLNHVVRYIIDHCLRHRIEAIVVGEWGDMKRDLKMRKQVGQLFQTLPYGWLKQKLRYKAALHDIAMTFVEESYTSQDCSGCGLRRKANRVHRGLYRCIDCGLELNADINGALNIMGKVAPEQVCKNLQWGSGEITSPSRIRLVEFV